jgi:hypothetical protein
MPAKDPQGVRERALTGARSDLHKMLKIFSIECEISVTALIDEAVTRFLKEELGEEAFQSLFKRCQGPLVIHKRRRKPAA